MDKYLLIKTHRNGLRYARDVYADSFEEAQLLCGLNEVVFGKVEEEIDVEEENKYICLN